MRRKKKGRPMKADLTVEKKKKKTAYTFDFKITSSTTMRRRCKYGNETLTSYQEAKEPKSQQSYTNGGSTYSQSSASGAGSMSQQWGNRVPNQAVAMQ